MFLIQTYWNTIFDIIILSVHCNVFLSEDRQLTPCRRLRLSARLSKCLALLIISLSSGETRIGDKNNNLVQKYPLTVG